MRGTRTLLLVALFSCVKAPAVAPAPQMISDGKTVTLSPDAPQWRYLELAVAQEGPRLDPLSSPGHVDFDERMTANVGVPLTGRVESVEVRFGDPVKKGDRLFSVRSGAFADLDHEVEASRADVAVKEHMLQRLRDLYALKAAAEKDVIAAEAELKVAQLTRKAAEAKRQSLSVDSAGDNLFWVHAPRAGAVAELNVMANAEVTPDRDKPLLRISDLDEVLVLADVAETDVVDLKRGGAVRIRNGGTDRDGTIDHVSEMIDAVHRTVEVRVRLDNRDRTLRPNSFVEVTPIADPGVKCIRVPEGAVVNDGKRTLVFVTAGAARLQPRVVTVGRRRNGEVEITTGLESGTHYVSRGALFLLNQFDSED